MKLKMYQLLEKFWLQGVRFGEWCESMRQHCAYCPDCGRNRYTGPSCKN